MPLQAYTVLGRWALVVMHGQLGIMQGVIGYEMPLLLEMGFAGYGVLQIQEMKHALIMKHLHFIIPIIILQGLIFRRRCTEEQTTMQQSQSMENGSHDLMVLSVLLTM
jgi:hypothetical protein